ncbi:MAG TPA: hypothetical protein VF469_23610 [Kofleriaceae bacterium]
MRGRLINPLAAELAQLDTAATAADPDGPGPLTSGYDADFHETVLVPSVGGPRRDARREKPPIRVPCQIEVQAFGELAELATGNSPRSHLVLVFHFADLEQLGLVDPATGDVFLRVGDRLVAIRDLRTGALVQAVRTPPGLYLTEPQPQFGLGGRRNLLLATFGERALGPQST